MLFLVEDAEKTAREERAVAERRYEEYQDLFHGLTDPVYIHDNEGNILQVNDTAVEMLGYSEDDPLSMTPRDIVADEYEG